jgi:hypothetical protein
MDQDLLKQLVRNTMPKDSFQLILSGNTSEFTIRNEAPIKLDRESRYEVALVNLETYYSFPNIDQLTTYSSTQLTMVITGSDPIYLRVDTG